MPTPFDIRYLTRRKALLEERAARMRSWGTPSERRLWARLVNKKLGVSFRRQYVIGDCIVDFAAPSVRLVVEVDGTAHVGRERADARRDAQLRRAGRRVLRVEAECVMRELPAVLRAIVDALG